MSGVTSTVQPRKTAYFLPYFVCLRTLGARYRANSGKIASTVKYDNIQQGTPVFKMEKSIDYIGIAKTSGSARVE